jgi:hypothetical protein
MNRLRFPLGLLLAASAAFALTACGGPKATPDEGAVENIVPPSQEEGEAPPGLDEELKLSDKAADGWISAPWVLAVKPDTASADLQIAYVAGDAACVAPAGFTAKESGSKVTIGAYVVKAEDAKDCPTDPGWAVKWGTVKLSEPLGDRDLLHAGVDERFNSFTWDTFKAAEQPEESEEAAE